MSMVIPRLPFLFLLVISFVGGGDICPSRYISLNQLFRKLDSFSMMIFVGF